MSRKWFQKIGVCLLAASMVLPGTGVLKPQMALAEGEEEEYNDEDVFVIEDGVLVEYYSSEESSVIVIPEGVVEIAEGVFEEIEAESVVFPVGLKKIGAYAFTCCGRLKEILLPDTVTEIGDDVFSGCASLERVVLSPEITVIPDNAFYSCDNLTQVIVPESVKEIGSYAFSFCMKLCEISLPEGLEKIGESAFGDCVVLSRMMIPDSVTSVGKNAFCECGGLTDIAFPAGLTKIESGVLTGASIVSVYIPRMVEEISETWMDSPILKDIFYGGTEQEWEALAVSVSDQVTVHYDCDRAMIDEAEQEFLVDSDGVFVRYRGEGGEVIVPEGVKEIGASAFKGKSRVTQVVLPETVTMIGANAFSNCGGLNSIVLPENLTQIGKYAFSECHNLEEVVFPEGLAEIGERAFYETGLTHIEWPTSGEIRIGKRAFSSCDNLIEVVIPKNVVEMGTSVFSHCQALERVDIQPGVTTIPEDTFYVDNNLHSVRIPNTVTSIGAYAFRYVYELEELYIPASVTEIGTKAVSMDNIKNIYFGGTEEAWQAMQVGIGNETVVHFQAAEFLFTDVPRGGWKETAVRYMLDHKLMNGKTQTTFAPETTMNRGQLVTVMWNMAGKPSVTGKMPFKDVTKTNTFYKAILWASQNKIVSGYANGTFGPKDPLTRQQIAAILMNYAKFSGVEIANKTDINSFADASSVSKAMTSAVQWAVGNKIISGKSGGTLLDPKGEVTRVEVAAMVMNYCKKILGM